MKLPRYNHMIDVAFTIDSDHEDIDDIPTEDLVAALLNRVASILSEPAEREGFGLCDTYENPQLKDEEAS